MDDFYFISTGTINTWPGINLSIKKKETHELIGHIFLLDFDTMYDYDKKIKNILDTIEDYTTYDFLRESITVFLHNFKIDEKFRNNGYGKILRKETENIAKNYNYIYVSSVTNTKNIISQSINRKLGYSVLKTYKDYDFFLKKLNFWVNTVYLYLPLTKFIFF